MKSLKYIILILLISTLVLVFINKSKTEAPIYPEFNVRTTQTRDVNIQDILGQLDDNQLRELGIEIDRENRIISATFKGILTEVNTGCFADGECFVVVDDKKVTAIEGWKKEIVGRTIIEGNENSGFGDLYTYLGNQVEVYAAITDQGEYTLYGSEDYYIKIL